MRELLAAIMLIADFIASQVKVHIVEKKYYILEDWFDTMKNLLKKQIRSA